MKDESKRYSIKTATFPCSSLKALEWLGIRRRVLICKINIIKELSIVINFVPTNLFLISEFSIRFPKAERSSSFLIFWNFIGDDPELEPRFKFSKFLILSSKDFIFWKINSVLTEINLLISVFNSWKFRINLKMREN